MADIDEVRATVEPVLADLGLSCYDARFTGTGGARTLQVLVDREGPVDLEVITEATRAVSTALDRVDPVSGPYLLEVSSPGLERPLRTVEHFAGAIGEVASVKHRPGGGGTERVRGVVESVDDDGCVLAVDGTPVRIAFADVTGARTVFEWGGSEGPGGAPGAGRRTEESSRS